MSVYYNEIDAYCAAWLRNLIRMGVIPAGYVDERDIAEVRPEDLVGYRQCHFFAGLGGWPFALRLAEWPDDKPVWTASCPCQTHSSAARGRNTAPDLWPTLARLVVARSPRVIFGEQVANVAGWFDRVCDDLENMDYTIGAAVLPACSVGQDHQRARLYFVGDTDRNGEPGSSLNAEASGLSLYRGHPTGVELPHGVSARVAQMRAFGNAIVPQVAAAFVQAYLEARG